MKLIICGFICVTLVSCGLNELHQPAPVRALTPDRIGITWRMDDEYETQGYSVGLSWKID